MSDIDTFTSELQEPKAFLPIFVMLAGRTMLVNDEQDAKAEFPITLRVSGKTNDVIFAPLNASSETP